MTVVNVRPGETVTVVGLPAAPPVDPGYGIDVGGGYTPPPRPTTRSCCRECRDGRPALWIRVIARHGQRLGRQFDPGFSPPWAQVPVDPDILGAAAERAESTRAIPLHRATVPDELARWRCGHLGLGLEAAWTPRAGGCGCGFPAQARQGRNNVGFAARLQHRRLCGIAAVPDQDALSLRTRSA